MLNRFEKPQMPSEARLRYLDGDFQIEVQGTFVRCAVTSAAIPLDELKYWSVELQEAYADPESSLKRYKDIKGIA
ncbi:DUF2093 domain-containing protein [Roseibium sp. CAU 1637]|uniref:DUF2093 domain-containing protein n=1 Tax=Roseibium limicola TaxID=2816037 RepID=A0A939EN98_9HYPH|nr:DUF2093 domain-containing protein [Roseibium limicola]MBO0345880.1 DUF2093 domain-containing protein [Roseibium limicola]